MSRSTRATSLLFGLMLLTGGSSLAACLVLPPWLEYRRLLTLHARTRQRIARLEARLENLDKQITHLRHDPAYLERLAHREFGIATPGVQAIPLQHSGRAPARPAGAARRHPARPGARPGLGARLARAAERSALLSVFVLDQTRPIVIGMSLALLFAALALLRAPRRRGPQHR